MYEENYVPDPRHAAAATSNSYTVDTNWYTDSGAIDHITEELEKLSFQKYHGDEQIHTANGAGMSISNVGEAIVSTQNHDLKLKQILHVPHAKKSLISVHRFTSDNNVLLKFHPYFFLIKDRATRRLLLKGRCHKGLYPLPASLAKLGRRLWVQPHP
jgi:hypothetical protein